jgi:hypothetical protein
VANVGFAEKADVRRSIAEGHDIGSWRVCCSPVSGRRLEGGRDVKDLPQGLTRWALSRVLLVVEGAPRFERHDARTAAAAVLDIVREIAVEGFV